MGNRGFGSWLPTIDFLLCRSCAAPLGFFAAETKCELNGGRGENPIKAATGAGRNVTFVVAWGDGYNL
jgi:hypothetical protein